jgi:DNA-binding LytR/AlgR family response regulator
MINCIIVDDEKFSINALTKYIELMPTLNVVNIYTDPRQALEEVTEGGNIDLLFMDIDMPQLSGIELARGLRYRTNKLIFTTAHSRYAFDAFEAEGDAFLLKPYSFNKFSLTINRLFPNAEHSEGHLNTNINDTYFLVKNKDENLRIKKVNYDDVVAFESFQNYIKIHLINDTIIVAYLTIKDVLEILGPRQEFKQFHRAFVIATQYVSFIEGNTIKMVNNLTITVGDLYKNNFTSFLSKKLMKTLRNR